jgi:hypothetical protein
VQTLRPLTEDQAEHRGSQFFPVGSASDTMDREALIAAEYGFQVHPDTPIYKFQQLSEQASARREKRIEAANQGLVYHG